MLVRLVVILFIPVIFQSCIPSEENRIPTAEYQKGLGKKIRNEKAAKIYRVTGYKYYKHGNYEKALEFYSKALLKYKELSKLYHPEAGELYLKMGDLYIKMGDNKEALRFYFKALKIFKKYYGPDHLLTAVAYRGLGSVYENISDYKKAYYFYKKSLPAYEQEFGENHKKTITIKEKLRILSHKIKKTQS